MRLRLIVPADKVTDGQIAQANCERVGETPEGKVVLDWPYRSMGYKGDDESALIAVQIILKQVFGIGVGEFTVDWQNSVY